MWRTWDNVKTEVQNKKGKCLLKTSIYKKKKGKKEKFGHNLKKDALR